MTRMEKVKKRKEGDGLLKQRESERAGNIKEC
jgi:hypothetical protein